MTRKKTLRSPSTRSTMLGPDTVTGSALADADAEEELRTSGEDTIGRETEAPRGPLPPHATKEDYVGGGETRRQPPPGRRSGRRNQLV
jgi:hypothetical protein